MTRFLDRALSLAGAYTSDKQAELEEEIALARTRLEALEALRVFLRSWPARPHQGEAVCTAPTPTPTPTVAPPAAHTANRLAVPAAAPAKRAHPERIHRTPAENALLRKKAAAAIGEGELPAPRLVSVTGLAHARAVHDLLRCPWFVKGEAGGYRVSAAGRAALQAPERTGPSEIQQRAPRDAEMPIKLARLIAQHGPMKSLEATHRLGCTAKQASNTLSRCAYFESQPDGWHLTHLGQLAVRGEVMADTRTPVSAAPPSEEEEQYE